MRREDIQKYLHKKIKINLKAGLFFTGTIDELKDDCFVFTDKFAKCMVITYSEISFILELNESDQHG